MRNFPMTATGHTALQDELKHRIKTKRHLLAAWIQQAVADDPNLVEDTGERLIFQIVGEPEADAARGKISVGSPLARALIGKTKGTVVVVEAPGGDKIYRIEEVKWI